LNSSSEEVQKSILEALKDLIELTYLQMKLSDVLRLMSMETKKPTSHETWEKLLKEYDKLYSRTNTVVEKHGILP
jgi:Ca2+-binding EF-hand superfamily protein